MDIKKLLFKWFDKVILLIALAFLGWTMSRINPPKTVEELKDHASKLIKVVQHKMDPAGDSQPPEIKKLDYLKRIEKAYEPISPVPPRARTAWYPPRDMVHLHTVMRTLEVTHAFDHPLSNAAPRVEPDPGGGRVALTISPDRKSMTIKGEQEGVVKIIVTDAMEQRHVIVVNVIAFVPEPKVYQPKKPEVSLLPGSKIVKITWEPPDSVDNRAPIEWYTLYRKKESDKDFTKLKVIPLEQAKGKQVPGGGYEDSDTAFDATYEYAVTSYSKPASPSESQKSAAAVVYIHPDVTFVLKSATPTKAGVKVYKWLESHGWVNKTFFVGVGEELGELFKGGMIRDGKYQKVEIDFRTGCFLVDIEARAPIRTVIAGRVADFNDSRIVYVDKNGNLKEKWRFEPDVAPWAWFQQQPPERRKPESRERPEARRKGPGGMEQDLQAVEQEERRRQEEEEMRKREKRGVERPEEIK